MISRRRASRVSVSFAALLAWLICAATGCSSGELEPGPSSEAVGHTAEALDSFCTVGQPITSPHGMRSSLDWASLSPQSLPFMDVNTDLACAISVLPAGQVNCYVPNGNGALTSFLTNWGGGCSGPNGTGTCSGIPITNSPNSPPQAVAILKHTEIPYRFGGGNYGVYVLLADGRIMVTNGDSDKLFQGTNFKTYSLFLRPTSSTGQTLSIKKIVWVDEDGMGDPSLHPYLAGLTTDNSLYYSDYSGRPWQLYMTDVRDVSHLPGRGDTVLFTSGQVEYGAFNPSAWRGVLPNPPNGSTIVAVGGMYALTNDGCHGDCADNISTFCTGDDTRILRFDWFRWKWEPYVARLAEQDAFAPPDGGSHTAGYYPISPGYTCPGCSPQIVTSIVDPHDFGSNGFQSSAPVGPFVYSASGSRTQYYNSHTALQSPLTTCLGAVCSTPCGQLPDGTPCGYDSYGNTRVCTTGQCQVCGGTHQAPCPGLDCSYVPGGAAAAVVRFPWASFQPDRCVLLSEAFGNWSGVGGGAYSAPAVNSRGALNHEVLDLYATRTETGDLNYNVGQSPNAGVTWNWAGWLSLGQPPTGIMGKPASTRWTMPCTGTGCAPYVGGAVAVRSQVGAQSQIFVKYLASDGSTFSSWGQVSSGNLERDPAIAFSPPDLIVFAVGTDHQFYLSKNDLSYGYSPANWQPWQHIPGGNLTSEGSVAVSGMRLLLSARGSDNQYYINESTNLGYGWSGWNVVLPSSTTFASAPAIHQDGYIIRIFGTGAASGGIQPLLWNTSTSPSAAYWNTFQSAGGNLTSAPASVDVGSPSTSQVFARGTDNRIYQIGFNNNVDFSE